MKRILVTGGAGFIGSAVIAHLQKQKHEIFVIDNLSFGNRQFINIDDSHFFNADILDEQRLDEIIGKIRPQYIIHLAAVHFIPYCNQHPYESSNINIRGTMHLLKAAQKYTPEKVFLHLQLPFIQFTT